jgi:hypothetical protein
MALTPQERRTFDELANTLQDEGVLKSATRVRRAAGLYSFGAFAGIVAIYIPLATKQLWLAVPIFIGATWCALRALHAWKRVSTWNGDEPVSRRSLFRLIIGL